MKKFSLLMIIVSQFFYHTSLLFAGDATLTWDRSPDTNVTGYKVHYGTAPRSYTTSIDAGNVSSFTVTGLSNLTYYFAVVAYNAEGLQSSYSNEVSKSFSSTPDTLSPILSGINAEAITSTGARIAWSTDEPSDTQVQYGLTTTYGASTSLAASLTTLHVQTLAGLLPATLYHYRVLSRDAAGNLSVSSDTTFTTMPLPDTTSPTAPGSLTAASISSFQINLTWAASTDNIGVIGYHVERCRGTGCSNFTQIATPTGTTFSNTGLASSTPYSYRVRAVDAAGNLSAYSNVAGATTSTATSPRRCHKKVCK